MSNLRSRKPKALKQEHRSNIKACGLEVRDAGGVKKLSGYAVVFNSPADIGGAFIESIAPGAFSRTLKDDDQVMLRDHQSELLLGRRSAGTLKLSQDETGLYFEVTLPDTATAADTYENVRVGNLKGCSFGFIVRDDTWTQDADGQLTRVIKDAQVFEVTLTAFPAYDATSIAISRSARAKLKGDDFNLEDDDDDSDDDDDDSEDYRCSYRCSACRSADFVHLSNLAEDNPAARSKRKQITRASTNLSEDDLRQEATRCAFRCAACRSLLSGHFPSAITEDDSGARSAHHHLLRLRSR